MVSAGGILFILGTVFVYMWILVYIDFYLPLTYIPNSFGEILFENLKNLQRMYEAIFAKSWNLNKLFKLSGSFNFRT